MQGIKVSMKEGHAKLLNNGVDKLVDLIKTEEDVVEVWDVTIYP